MSVFKGKTVIMIIERIQIVFKMYMNDMNDLV